MLETLSAAWREHLKSQFPPTERLYIDPRGREYPHLPDSDGSPQFTRLRDNQIDRGNCESDIAPMIAGETVPLLAHCTSAKSETFAHAGNSSRKITKTSAAGSFNAFAYFTDDNGAADLHGMIPGSSVEAEIKVKIPTASGIDVGEVLFVLQTDGVTRAAAGISALDAFETIKLAHTLEEAAAGFTLLMRIDGAADPSDIYFDDVSLKSHVAPGSHALTGGYIETLCPMTEKFTLQIKFKPNFAYDTALFPGVWGWYVSATQRFFIFYNATDDKFLVTWYDGGTLRRLISAQYDDGSAFRNINQYSILTAAIDLSTGTTAGSSLWINKTQDDTTWSGNIDAKSTEFNKAQIRANNGTAGAYDIAYALLIPNIVATDADVQNDFADITAEQIHWDLNGHTVGRTRCNITPRAQRITTRQELINPDSGAYGANSISGVLINRIHRENMGLFSDDQYAAFDPTLFQYNGTEAQSYLKRAMNITLETWYGGDHDTVFFGKTGRSPFKRVTGGNGVGVVLFQAEDAIAQIARFAFRRGRFYDGYAFARGTNMLDRGSCEWALPPMAPGETVPVTTNATFDRSASESYRGRYSRKHIITAGGSDGSIVLADNADTDDLHGFKAGKTYKIRAKIKIASGSILGSEITIRLRDYQAGWAQTSQAAANTYDAFQIVELTRTIRSSATGAYIELLIDSAASSTERYHINEIEVICTDDQSENEQTSILHELVRAATQADIRQYLANNSFENATIGNSWLVTGGSLTNPAGGIFGSKSARLANATGSTRYLYQMVTFGGERKLNVGETYLVWFSLYSSAAAAHLVSLREDDADGTNDQTNANYSLDGGEGEKIVFVAHTITDQDSDRLVAQFGVPDGKTVLSSGAILASAKEMLWVFQENGADGAAGVSDADDADTINYDRVGLDIDAFTLVHPFRRIEANESLWEHIRAMSESGLVEYVGCAGCGTFEFHARLGDAYEEAVPTSNLPTNPRVINTEAISSMINKLIVHGVIIKKHEVEWMMWYLSGSGLFDLTETGKPEILVGNGSTFPDADEFGEELVALYGDSVYTGRTYKAPEPEVIYDLEPPEPMAADLQDIYEGFTRWLWGGRSF